MICVICGKQTKLFFQSEKDLCISSDSKIRNEGIRIYQCISCHHIQKLVDEKYRSEVINLYNDYEIYAITGGEEQVKFQKGQSPQTRSSMIIDHIKDALPPSGKLLDIGCGNGAFLKAFSAKLQNWDIYAQDIHDDCKEEILKIRNVKDFFAGPLSGIDAKFNFISLIHSFEHVEHPIQILKDIKTLLKKDGLLLIQVPNISENVFDGLIYDHISHFTPSALARVVGTVFHHIFFPTQQIKKEITLLANSQKIFPNTPQKKVEWVYSSSTNLENLNKLTRDVENIIKPTGVFGTANLGVYIGYLLDDFLAFFVDEDENRKGKSLLGKKVYHPRDVVHGTDVLLPFDPKQASEIRERWKHLNYITISI